MNMTETFELEEVTTEENRFVVRVDNISVAEIVETDTGWYGASDCAKTVYGSPLLAAFADANLSNPAYWTE